MALIPAYQSALIYRSRHVPFTGSNTAAAAARHTQMLSPAERCGKHSTPSVTSAAYVALGTCSITAARSVQPSRLIHVLPAQALPGCLPTAARQPPQTLSATPNCKRVTAASAAASDSGSATDNTHSPSTSQPAAAGGLLGVFQQWNQDTKKLREQLQSLGLAGVVAYGLFNTAYYTVAFLFVWFTVANVPAGLGLQAAARKSIEVFALVWAGSQVTKLLRAGGALAFAPVVDRGLTWAVEKFRLRNKQQVFGIVVAACLALAAAVFIFVVALHA